MFKGCKILVVCVSVFLALMLVGCTEANDLKGEASDISSTASQKDENSSVDGIELPEEEFDSSQQTTGSQNENIIQDKNNETISSAQDNSTEETTSSDDNPDKESASSSDDSHGDTSSDDTSVPSESQDGNLELPMDKW